MFDMDGVLWKSCTPLCDLPKLFEKVRKSGYRFIFATNNATQSKTQYVKKFEGFGVSIDRDQVITSGQATAHYMKKKYPEGGPVYVVGEEGLIHTLEEQGFYFAEKDVLAVVVGLDRFINYDKLKIATLLVRSGVDFIGTNPDTTYPTPEGLVPGGGTFIATIQVASDVTPTIIGKPFPAMLDMARDALDMPKGQILAIGDRLDTDILGAQQYGFKSALVLSGVSTEQELSSWSPKPDLVCSNVMDIFN
jgi:4-nitrophenyl phosphatase